MKQYHELLKHVLARGESHDDRTGVGTISTFGYQIRFDLRSGFPLMTTKRLAFRWIAEELFWFLSGNTNEHDLRAKGVDIWQEWATEEQCAKFGRSEGDLGPVYGFLWRHFGGDYSNLDAIVPAIYQQNGVDQIARLLRDIDEQPNSRRLLVSGWDPAQCDNVALPPCHTVYQFKVHPDRSLSCHLYARSIDSFLGLPYNIASYALLTEMVAFVTGRMTRELIISFGDLHIYKNHLDQVDEQLSRKPKELPSLDIWPSRAPTGYSPLEKLLDVKYDDLQLEGYDPWPSIKAPVAI